MQGELYVFVSSVLGGGELPNLHSGPFIVARKVWCIPVTGDWVNSKSDVVMMTTARTRKVWDTTLVISSIASPFIEKFSCTLKINVTK